MSACESPFPLLSKSAVDKSILPDSLVRIGLTLCSNDPTKFVYDKTLWEKPFGNPNWARNLINLDTFPDLDSKAAYILDIVNTYDTIKNFSEIDLLQPPQNGENMRKLMNLTQTANNADAMKKYILIKNTYNALVAAIAPMSTNTGNPNSEYNYQFDDTKKVVFRCTVCKNNYAGSNCDKCAKGFGNLNGEGDCSLCNDDYCSGHGRNCVVMGGTPKCTVCDPGYSGPDCSGFAPVLKPCPNACSGRGKCDGATGLCDCNAGYSGPDCSGSAPVPKPCPNACSGRGKCDGATGLCDCNAGYSGPDCSGHGHKHKPCPKKCSGRGKCDKATGLCDCNAGYSGPDCSGSAPVPKPCPNACGGRGKCNETTGLCDCNAGYSGPDCSGSVPVPKPCPNACSGRGKCDSATGKCVCNAGSGGADCSTIEAGCRKTPDDATDCSGNGECVGNTCGCVPGWSGVYCDSKSPISQCPSDKSGNLCGNNGFCVGGKCQCRAGWQGNDCTEKDDSSLLVWLGLGLLGILVVVLVVWWESRKSLGGFGV